VGVYDGSTFPSSPSPPDPNTWDGKVAAAQEAKRLQRQQAHEAARARERAARAAHVAAENRRREENAPRIAALDQRIASLRAERDPIEAAYRRAVAPIDGEIRALRNERETLT
jgi:hypothetical protein